MSSSTDSNCFAMILRSRILKVFLVLGLSFMFTAVYINFFQHPPADMLLAMNSRAQGSQFGPPRDFGGVATRNSKPSRGGRFGSKRRDPMMDDEDEEEEDVGKVVVEEEEDEEEDVGGGNKNNGRRSEDDSYTSSKVKYEDYWNKFLQRNNFVTIGAVYDRCENWRVQYGTVVMLPDKEAGGVKSRTFVNLTLEHEIDGGQFNLEVKYNGKDLYDNYWEICELDDELPPENRTFACPVAKGHHIKVKDRHIPNYLPKGRYQAKAWASDEDEKIFACGYSDFTI